MLETQRLLIFLLCFGHRKMAFGNSFSYVLSILMCMQNFISISCIYSHFHISHFYSLPQTVARVLYYSLQNFECPSISPFICPCRQMHTCLFENYGHFSVFQWDLFCKHTSRLICENPVQSTLLCLILDTQGYFVLTQAQKYTPSRHPFVQLSMLPSFVPMP